MNLAKEIQTSEFSHVDEARLKQLIADAERILADADASMEEIHEIETFDTRNGKNTEKN